MAPYSILLRKELRAFFLSPVAYVVLAMIMTVQGVAFIFALRPLLSGPQDVGLVQIFFQGFLFWIPFFVIFPLITMRLFAEEQKMGTMEMLLTAPIQVKHVVVSKFAATMIFFAALWIPCLSYFYLYQMISGQPAAFEPGHLAGAAAFVFAIGAMNIAIGCFASALTSNQIVAAIIAFGIILMHFFLGHLPLTIGRLPPETQQFFEYIHSDRHLTDFAMGLIDSRVLTYYLTGALLFLGLTGYTLNMRRWHQ